MGLEKNTLYELLANPRRRAVIETFEPAAAPVSLDELARRVAAQEGEAVLESDLEPARVRRVVVSLYHNHLPRLADAGVLSFEREREKVSDGPHFHEVESLVDEVGPQML